MEVGFDLIVLKGHLLIEEQLRIIIEERTKRPEALKLDEKEWTFSQKLRLVEALCGEEVSDEVWGCVRLLNKIRNNLAHKLEPHGLEDQIRSFNAAWSSGFKEEKLETSLYMNLASVYIVVSGLVRSPSAEVLNVVRPRKSP